MYTSIFYVTFLENVSYISDVHHWQNANGNAFNEIYNGFRIQVGGGGGAGKCNIEALHTCKLYVSKYPPPPPSSENNAQQVIQDKGPMDLQIGCYENQGHLPPSKYPDDDQGGGSDISNRNLHFRRPGGCLGR